MRKSLIILMCILMPVIAGPSAAASQPPMESLRGPVNEVITILKDPLYQGESQKEAQWDKLWEVIQRVFDFSSTARLALGKYHGQFSAQQFTTFTEVFSELLANTYVRRLQGEYQNEKVNYLSEKIKGDKALVVTEIIREKLAIPVHYVMLQTDGNWRIYDVKVEGVSLVRNYRTQFQQILAENTPDHLIERLKKKVRDQEKSISGKNE